MDELNKKARLIFHKWKTELKNKDRSRPNVAINFDELISSWHRSGISFDLAFELMKEAIKEHQPTNGCARNTFKRLKAVVNKSEEEFIHDWFSNIEATAYQSFYSQYDIEGEKPPEPVKNHGSMSEKEYKLQRQYADSYPEVDLDKISHEPISEEEILAALNGEVI